ncbi:peptide MFS transporter [Weissella soli]|uniref:peptide MFS transporter n=1 Tax=Weissella soli TaxID=155866 RepID=UPI0021C0D35D|nr:oligopeptide:H+ symporter [Weissella soli]MCT8395647.1 MFS transporter [Weissella soli]
MQEKKTGIFGFPKGYPTVLGTEFAERFSYYGMKAILLYYMVATVGKGGLGFDNTTAVAVVSMYGALIYMSAVIGGWLADRIFGTGKIIIIGGFFILAGHVVLALPIGASALFVSLALLILGTGMLKPNVSTFVGQSLDNEKDYDYVFSFFYVAINVASFISPFMVGYLQNHYGYHYGFGLAAIVMGIGLFVFMMGRATSLKHVKTPAPNPIKPEERGRVIGAIVAGLVVVAAFFGITANIKSGSFALFNNGQFNSALMANVVAFLAIAISVAYFVRISGSKLVTKVERRKVLAFIPIWLAGVSMWAVQEGAGSVGASFIEKANLHVGFFDLQKVWLQSVNPFVVMILTTIMGLIYKKYEDKLPNLFSRYALGLLIVAASYFLLMPAAAQGHGFSAMWVFGSVALTAVGEVLISPVTYGVTNRLAPKSFESQMMSLWLLSNSVAQSINAVTAPLFISNANLYFMIFAIIPMIFAVILFIFRKPLLNLVEN